MDLSDDPIAPFVQQKLAEIFAAGVKLKGGSQYNKVFNTIYNLKADCDNKQTRINELEKILTGLVNLKELKDTDGKTEVYKQLQPIAWKQAKELLNR